MRRFLVSTRLAIAALAVWLTSAETTKADFIVSVSSATIPTDGTSLVDIYVTSNSLSGDQLGSFQLQLITSVVSSPTTDGLNLSFTASQPIVNNISSYVFFGSSAAQDYSFPYWATPTSTLTNNDTIVGGDFNDSTPGYTNITQGTTYLLGQVQVYNPGQAGDVFSIALAPPSGSGSGQTYFQDADGNDIDFSSTASTITTSSVLSTPEPSSPVLAGIGILCYWLLVSRSHRRGRKSLNLVV